MRFIAISGYPCNQLTELVQRAGFHLETMLDFNRIGVIDETTELRHRITPHWGFRRPKVAPGWVFVLDVIPYGGSWVCGVLALLRPRMVNDVPQRYECLRRAHISIIVYIWG